MSLPLLAELQRRRVFRALIGYAIAAFAVLQIIEPIVHGLHWSEAVVSYAVVALAVGFPLVVGLAWIFDVNAGRIERTAPVATGAIRGVPLALLLLGLGVVAAAPGVFYYFVVRGNALSPDARRSMAAAPSIAVLPFADMSPGKDQEYFGDGVAEEILNALSQVESLRVSGRTSSFAFKGRSEDLGTIAEKLHVATVLEGSVRKAGSRVRITAQLINAGDGYHLWSQAYDRELTDVIAVQDEIARTVVAALKVKLLPGKEPGSRPRREWKPEAYDQYLIARRIMAGLYTRESEQLAQDAVERSLALDPGQAAAWALFSQIVFWKAAVFGRAPAELAQEMRKAVEASERAVQLDPELAEAYEARGLVRSSYQWDWNGARSDLERALALNPGSAHAHRRYGVLLFDLGRGAEAVGPLRKATDLDPLAAGSWVALGSTYVDIGELALARTALGRALELATRNDLALMNLGDCFLLEGQPEAALAEYQKSLEEESRLLGSALAEHSLGHPREAQRALDQLVRMYGAGRPFDVAQVHAWRGDRERAFEWLERALAQRDVGLREIKLTRFLRPLHGDPRFALLLKKMNLPLD